MALIADMHVDESASPSLLILNICTAFLLWAQLHHVIRVLGKVLQHPHIHAKSDATASSNEQKGPLLMAMHMRPCMAQQHACTFP